MDKTNVAKTVVVRRLLWVAPWFLFVVLGFAAYAQAQDAELVPVLPDTAFNYANPVLPAHFTSPELLAADNTPASNPTTDEGATLGRVLFYDTQLSANGATSCSSCHIQANAFSDPDRLSTGFAGEQTSRHSMSLVNARYYERGSFFWDERAATLEDQVLMPIQDSAEMGLTLDELEVRLAGSDYYPQLFEDAFGTPETTSERVSLALAQFVRSMVSTDSKYDEGVANRFRNFTDEERLGRQVFNTNTCAVCHGTDAQIAVRPPTNNGLDLVTTDVGAGQGRMKVPSLRNIALSAPYMHDGRFSTLEQVIEHYNSGVQANADLDPPLDLPGRGVDPTRLNLTQVEKDALLAFLNTLTDTAFSTDKKFSDPFQLVQVVPTATATPTGATCGGRAVTLIAAQGVQLTGTAGDDVIMGSSGDDLIDGAGGNDRICGDGGADTITGGAGNDIVWGGSGDDVIQGGDGDDTLHGNRGNDQLHGGDGHDRIFGYTDNDQIFGGAGDDRLHGNFGDDELHGDDGNDRIFGYGDNDIIHGGDGDDLAGGNFGDDILHGGDGNDRLYGSDGEDLVNGDAGDDTLEGNSLADTLNGGIGNDTLDGGIDADVCNGDSGTDTATRCETITGLP